MAAGQGWAVAAEAEHTGFDVLRVDCNKRPPEKIAEVIRDRLTSFFGSSDTP